MPESIKIISPKEAEEMGKALFAELEERTAHLSGAIKEEAKMRILENEKGFVFPQSERIRYYVNYILEVAGKEPEEGRLQKILEMLEKEGLFTKEELEILVMGEKAKEKGELSLEDEKKIEEIIKKDGSAGRWIKKVLLLGALITLPLHKEKISTPEKIKEEKESTNTLSQKPDSAKKAMARWPTPYKEWKADFSEKIPESLEKPVEFFKNLDFIKENLNFYVLDIGDSTKPVLYELSKDGKLLSSEIVGIGQEGHETSPGIYYLSDYIHRPETDNIYGADGVLALRGYTTDGERSQRLAIHRIYPPEEKERTAKMLNPESSKKISKGCVNVFPENFAEITKNYRGEFSLFLGIVSGKNFEKEKGKWEAAVKKMNAENEDWKKFEEEERQEQDLKNTSAAEEKKETPENIEEIKIKEQISQCGDIIKNERYGEILKNPYLVSALYYSDEAIKKMMLAKQNMPEKIIMGVYPLITKKFRENYLKMLEKSAAENAGNKNPGKESLPLKKISFEKSLEGNHPDAIDLFAEEGSPIYSVSGELVVLAENGWTENDELSTSSVRGGNTVIIFNPQNKSFYRYAHLQKTNVQSGIALSGNEAIGLVGHTGINASKPNHGNHVHFEINQYDPKKGVMVPISASELQKKLASLEKIKQEKL